MAEALVAQSTYAQTRQALNVYEILRDDPPAPSERGVTREKRPGKSVARRAARLDVVRNNVR